MTTLYCPRCDSRNWEIIGIINENPDDFFAVCGDCGLTSPTFHNKQAFNKYWYAINHATNNSGKS